LPARALLDLLGALVGFFFGTVLRVRRAHVEASMRAAGFPDARARCHTTAMYRALGVSACEFLWLAPNAKNAKNAKNAPGARKKTSPLDGVARIEASSRAKLDDAMLGGRGIVLAASHTGNWDLAACAFAQAFPLLVITKHLKMRRLDAFWQSTRAAYGVALSDAAGAVKRARAALARGGAVAMMIDQVPALRRHGVAVEFLGREAIVDRAPAALAALTGAPLVVAASHRAADGAQEIEVLRVLLPPPRPGRRWIEDATREATHALDAFVREHPSEWLWLHRRWRAPGA
jgi:Kdo2-lipid IVA lauroyltransferase/acyltransferase